jgi:hypothetical protein
MLNTENVPSKKKKYDTKCEIYSFGILLWEVAECRIPYERFEDFGEIAKEVIKGYRESFTEGTDIPEKYQDLVREAVDQNPDHRPTFAKMLIDLQDILIKRTAERGDESSLNAVDIKRIEWNELTDIKEIGFGGFGSICKARWLKNDDYVVIKNYIIQVVFKKTHFNVKYKCKLECKVVTISFVL